MAGMNETPKGGRIHIGIFGRRNAGKSSIINAICGQQLAIVSDVAGTTTDPVSKAMELLPLGPVEIIDTPGLDDVGELGELRIEKAYQVLRRADLALVVCTGELTACERELIAEIKLRAVPYLVVFNKSDIIKNAPQDDNAVCVSAKTGEGIFELKERLAHLLPAGGDKPIVGDILSAGDSVVLVVPIDSAAPKGRLILPQQLVLRDVLDNGAVATVCRDTELADTLALLKSPPRLVITDSQAFGEVSKIVPADVPLTSFSIIMARLKGDLRTLADGAAALENIPNGARVLICEGCTHHRQCDDIGTVKLPRWIAAHTGKSFKFEFTSGGEFPAEPGDYALVVHCGGCMLNEREMHYRIAKCRAAGVPIVNYGVLIAHMNGILARSLEPFSGKF